MAQPGSDAINGRESTLVALQDATVKNRPPTAGDDKLVFTYKVRENLDVQVIFENDTFYPNAVPPN